MKHLILVAALALGVAGSAFAGELDNEASVINQSAMNNAVVVRVDKRDNSTAIATASAKVGNEIQAQALAQTASFSQVAPTNVRGELDKDGGSSSWYFYNGYNSYYSYMYWYGSWYRPCYTYSYGYYSYYYYSNFWW